MKIMTEVSINKQARLSERKVLAERSPKGTYWLHFAVRPSDNRRKVRLIQT